MATTVRASSIATDAATTTAIAIAAPAGTTTGDVVIIVISWNDSSPAVTVADNNGSTPFTEDLQEFPNNGSAGHGASVFSRRIQAGDPSTYNFTLSALQRWTAVAVTFQNPHSQSIYDVAPSAGNCIAGGTSNPVSVPSIVTLSDAAIHCSICCTDGVLNTFSATPSGYTIHRQAGEKLVGFGTKVITTAAATGATTWSDTAGTTKTGISFAIKDETAPSTGLEVKIAGVTKKVQGLVFTQAANGHGTLTGRVLSDDGTYRPAIGNEVIVNEDGVRVWGGIIDAPSESRGDGTGGGAGIWTSLSAVDFNSFAARRYVQNTLEYPALDITNTTVANPTVVTTVSAHGMSTGESTQILGSTTTPSLDGTHVVTVLSSTTFSIAVNVTVAGSGGTARRLATLKRLLQEMEQYLTPYGVSLDPSQADGPPMPPLSYDYKRLDEVMNELSALSGWPWRINHSKVLAMKQPGTVSAPFNITSAATQVRGDIRVERQRAADYFNQVRLICGGNGLEEKTEYFYWQNGTVVGSIRSWNATYPVSQAITDKWPNTLIVNGVVQGPVKWGQADTTFTWGWDYENDRLTFHTSGTALSSGDKVTVVYAAQMPFTRTANDTAEQSAQGVFEKVLQAPTATTIEAGDALAAALLDTGVVETEIVKYDTFESEVLEPGQAQTITVPGRDLSGTYTITEVTARQMGPFLKRSVRAMSGSLITPDWRATYREWSSPGHGGSGGAATIFLATPLPATVPSQVIRTGDITIVATTASLGVNAAYKFERPALGTFGKSGDVYSVGAFGVTGSPDVHQLLVQNVMKGLGTASGGTDGRAYIALTAQGWNSSGSGSSSTESEITISSGPSGITGIDIYAATSIRLYTEGQTSEQFRFVSEASGVRPQLRILPGTQNGRLQAFTANQTGFSHNVAYTGSWNLDDTNKSGWAVRVVTTDDGDEFNVNRASAGANPRTPLTLLQVNSSGVLKLPNTSTQTTVGAAGAASALPGQPTGYLIIGINGTDRVIPYYAAA